VKFGIVYPNAGWRVERELVIKTAVAAEENGFDFMLTWDHYMLPGTSTTFDAWALIPYLAASTSKLRLGTCVSPLPFRPPQQFAKVIATVDQLSEGRVIVGVGAGWHKAEFDGFSEWADDRTRVSKVEEGVELMIRLWTEDRVDYKGKHYKATGAMLEPKPVQKPYPDLWFGSGGRKMLRIAARFGTGWIPTQISAEEYAARVPVIRRMVGARKFSYCYDLFDPLHKAEEYSSLIENLRASGCEFFAVNWKYNKEEWFDRLKWFSKEVIRSF
jgi:alkanesulfonate monooxygenase SsuD/methylene tetrahydromethanopterin reductase-like flavin-dependent oxidoreductase (luciferase family)